MILENKYKDVKPLSSLVPDGIIFVKNGAVPFNKDKRLKNWALVDGVAPKDVGLVSVAPGFLTGLYYNPNGSKGVVRDEGGNIVRLPFYLTEEELYMVNVLPADTGVVASAAKDMIPVPHRKLTKDEDLMSDGIFGGYMVVNLTSKVLSKEEESAGKLDQILNTVTLIKDVLMK